VITIDGGGKILDGFAHLKSYALIIQSASAAFCMPSISLYMAHAFVCASHFKT
jgi:hypothetical protein